jgi:hypothetical protein
MQIPVIHDRLAATREFENPPRIASSIESQIRLRALYEFVDFCHRALDEIERDLVHIEFGPAGLNLLGQVSVRLGRVGIEADSWGFNSMYEIAHSLQLLLVKNSGSVQRGECWEALQRGLEVLTALVEHCEPDFRLRLAVADVLDCISAASAN